MPLEMLATQQPPGTIDLTQRVRLVSQGIDRQGRVPGGQVRIDRPAAIRSERVSKKLNAALHHGVLGSTRARQGHHDKAGQGRGF